MSAILQDISEKLQKGKMKEVAELVKQAVADGIQPLTILNEGLMPGMDIIGERFKKNDIFIPEVLIDYLNEGTTTRNRFKSLRERFNIMCYYYGVRSTVARHFKFLMRELRRHF